MNASAVGITPFTEVCKTKVHPDTIDSSEMGHCEAVRLQGDFHNGMVIGAKFRLSIGGSMINGSPLGSSRQPPEVHNKPFHNCWASSCIR